MYQATLFTACTVYRLHCSLLYMPRALEKLLCEEKPCMRCKVNTCNWKCEIDYTQMTDLPFSNEKYCSKKATFVHSTFNYCSIWTALASIIVLLLITVSKIDFIKRDAANPSEQDSVNSFSLTYNSFWNCSNFFLCTAIPSTYNTAQHCVFDVQHNFCTSKTNGDKDHLTETVQNKALEIMSEAILSHLSRETA